MIKRIAVQAAALLLVAVAAAGNWAAWLGWDQQADIHPDGHVTGPYEAWQVVGLVVVLAGLVIIATIHRRLMIAIAGPTLGTMVAVCFDWSDDSTGLWGVGASMVFIGLLAGTFAVAALTRALSR